MNNSLKISWSVGLTTKNGKKLDQTESLKKIAELLAIAEIHAFSVAVNIGYWKGFPEQTLVISLIDIGSIGEIQAQNIAALFTEKFDQECVLATIEPVKYSFK